MAYFERICLEYKDYIKGYKLFTISEAFNAMMTRTTTLLTMDVRTCKLISVSREMMQEMLKNFKIMSKILAKCSNAMWDVLQT